MVSQLRLWLYDRGDGLDNLCWIHWKHWRHGEESLAGSRDTFCMCHDQADGYRTSKITGQAYRHAVMGSLGMVSLWSGRILLPMVERAKAPLEALTLMVIPMFYTYIQYVVWKTLSSHR